jgi:hypothetical protein
MRSVSTASSTTSTTGVEAGKGEGLQARACMLILPQCRPGREVEAVGAGLQQVQRRRAAGQFGGALAAGAGAGPSIGPGCARRATPRAGRPPAGRHAGARLPAPDVAWRQRRVGAHPFELQRRSRASSSSDSSTGLATKPWHCSASMRSGRWSNRLAETNTIGSARSPQARTSAAVCQPSRSSMVMSSSTASGGFCSTISRHSRAARGLQHLEPSGTSSAGQQLALQRLVVHHQQRAARRQVADRRPQRPGACASGPGSDTPAGTGAR